MTHAQTSTQAKGQRRRHIPATPTELLILLRVDYPQDTREERIERCADACVTRGLFHYELAEAWFRLHYNTIIEPSIKQTTTTTTEDELKERARNRAIATSNYVARAKYALTLASRMPNGKSLAECTGAELAHWGGQLVGIAAQVRPRQKVGDVFKTNADLAKLACPS